MPARAPATRRGAFGPLPRSERRGSLRSCRAARGVAGPVGGVRARTLPPVGAGTPAFPGFEFPAVAPSVDARREPRLVEQHQQAWNLLQAGESASGGARLRDLREEGAGLLSGGDRPGLRGARRARIQGSAPQRSTRRWLQRPTTCRRWLGRAEALLARRQAAEAIARSRPAGASTRHAPRSARARRAAVRASIERLVEEARARVRRGDLAEARDGLDAGARGFARERVHVPRARGRRAAGGRRSTRRRGTRRQAVQLDRRGRRRTHALVGEIETARGDLTRRSRPTDAPARSIRGGPDLEP